MGRKSKIEDHPDSNKIIKRLASGDEYSKIIEDFPGLRYQDLDYYVRNKLPKIISNSPELKQEIEEDQGNNTLAEVRKLKRQAVDILTEAQKAGDLRTALMGIREARCCLEAILKAEGQIKEQSVNVIQQQAQVNIKTETPEERLARYKKYFEGFGTRIIDNSRKEGDARNE